MTDETKSLTVREVSLADWQVIQAVAPAMYAARFFGVSNAEQAMAIMLTGRELGLGLAASFNLIHIVQGKPSLSPRGALALVLNSGILSGLKIDSTDTGCTVWMKRKDNGFEHTERFTIEDAKRAGLVKPDGAYTTYPRNLLKWRAVGFCIDTIAPDVAGGMKRADELGATIDDAGNVVEVPSPNGQAATVEAEAVREVPTEAATLQSLVDRFSADAVMQAAGGRIPGTLEEVAAVAAILEHAAKLGGE